MQTAAKANGNNIANATAARVFLLENFACGASRKETCCAAARLFPIIG
jgi:hypothetical protein